LPFTQKHKEGYGAKLLKLVILNKVVTIDLHQAVE